MSAAVASGTVAALVVVYGSLALVGVVPVVALCWSRVVLEDHTPWQVVAGSLLGATAITAGLLAL